MDFHFLNPAPGRPCATEAVGDSQGVEGTLGAGRGETRGDLTKEAASGCLCRAWRVALVPWPRRSCGVGVVMICTGSSEGSVRHGGLSGVTGDSEQPSELEFSCPFT